MMCRGNHWNTATAAAAAEEVHTTSHCQFSTRTTKPMGSRPNRHFPPQTCFRCAGYSSCMECRTVRRAARHWLTLVAFMELQRQQSCSSSYGSYKTERNWKQYDLMTPTGPRPFPQSWGDFWGARSLHSRTKTVQTLQVYKYIVQRCKHPLVSSCLPPFHQEFKELQPFPQYLSPATATSRCHGGGQAPPCSLNGITPTGAAFFFFLGETNSHMITAFLFRSAHGRPHSVGQRSAPPPHSRFVREVKGQRVPAEHVNDMVAMQVRNTHRFVVDWLKHKHSSTKKLGTEEKSRTDKALVTSV